jgi:hypothetical protein
VCSDHLSYPAFRSGFSAVPHRAADTSVTLRRTAGRRLRVRAPIRNRTVDLLLTMETLYRLSYWGKRPQRIHTGQLGSLIQSAPGACRAEVLVCCGQPVPQPVRYAGCRKMASGSRGADTRPEARWPGLQGLALPQSVTVMLSGDLGRLPKRRILRYPTGTGGPSASQPLGRDLTWTIGPRTPPHG